MKRIVLSIFAVIFLLFGGCAGASHDVVPSPAQTNSLALLQPVPTNEFTPEYSDGLPDLPIPETQRVTGTVYEFSAVETKPRPSLRVPPRYPFELRLVGLQGEVLIEFIANTEGVVAEAIVVRSTDPRFEAAALAAVRKWRFTPAMIDGKPVNCRLYVPITFTLHDDTGHTAERNLGR